MEAQLEQFIQQERPNTKSVRIENFQMLAGGYSQETYSADAIIENANGRETLPLIIRRDPPPEIDILPTNRRLEYLITQRVGEQTTIPVPTAHFLDEKGATLERPSMVIQRLSGSADLTPLFQPGNEDEAEAVATEFCERLAELHATSLDTLDPEGEFRDARGVGIDSSSWESYMTSSIEFFMQSYQQIAFDPLPVFYDMYASLPNRLPQPVPLAMCHGDYQPSNFLYEDGHITGVIDWEAAHVGDPREDIGWLYQLSGITGFDLAGSVKADGGFLQHYSKLSGIPVTLEDVGFFMVFSSAALAAPILDAVRRGLDGESQ
ncbi:MAG TPA: hypothetical protein DGL25_01355, partial [Dehalococcoidia bacterium]|nr:hypothetical protein [Dehalococcoidia bacterium]